MQTLKNLIMVAVLTASLIVGAHAEEKNGIRLSIQKTTLEREVSRDSNYWDKVDKSLGLKVAVRSVAMKPFEAGTIEWTIIVKRWGTNPTKFESYSGSQELAAVKPGEEVNLQLGKVQIGGWQEGPNRKQFVDSIEGWKVVVKHGGTETIAAVSGQEFTKLAERAQPGH